MFIYIMHHNVNIYNCIYICFSYLVWLLPRFIYQLLLFLYTGQTCYPDCKTKWEELKNGEPCLRGDPYTFMMWAVEKYFGEYADTLIKLMSVCEPKPSYTTDDMSDTWDDDDADDDVSDEWWGGEELLCDATYPKASGAPALCNAVMLSLSLVLVSVSLFF